MTPSNSNELGDFIYRARQERGLSLRTLAKASGLDWSYIAYLEKGEITTPDPAKLQKLARALEIEGLPQLAPYLRAKYDLPEAAGEEVERYVARLQKRFREPPKPQDRKRGRP